MLCSFLYMLHATNRKYVKTFPFLSLSLTPFKIVIYYLMVLLFTVSLFPS